MLRYVLTVMCFKMKTVLQNLQLRLCYIVMVPVEMIRRIAKRDVKKRTQMLLLVECKVFWSQPRLTLLASILFA